MSNTPGIPNEEHAEAFMAEKNREHAKWLATPLGRAGWLDLLMRCQNGEATCLFVLEKIEAEQSLLSNDEMFQALGIAMEHIERGGANIELTGAVIMVGDVRAAIGNRWNPAQKERAAMVRAKLKPETPRDAGLVTDPDQPGEPPSF